MNRFEHDRLADEILRTDELADLRRDSLDQGLRALRRGQQRRRALRLSALAGAPLILALGLQLWGRVSLVSRSSSTHLSLGAAPPAASAGAGQIKFINDEELLALFPDRPVALIGKPGRQELVFLDDLAAARRAAQEYLAGGGRFQW
jgi:hypothetical protein